MDRKRNHDTLSDEKNMTLFINYLKVIKRHGEYATKITVESKIEEAARPFFISTSRAKHIIGSMLRQRGYSNSITIMECNDILTELDQITASRNRESDFDDKVSFLLYVLPSVGVKHSHEEVKKMVQEYLVKRG